MSLIAVFPKFRAALRQSLHQYGVRSMTVLSKQSAEEYKKMVSHLLTCFVVVGKSEIVFYDAYTSYVSSGSVKHTKNYTSRMKETGRPVSPHVTIYSFPIGALSSITNRVTGVALSLGCAGLGAIELVGGSGTALQVMQMVGSSSTILAAGAKFSVAFPISYHYLGALRHIAWDNKPDMLTNVDVEKSSYILFGASTVLSAGTMFI
jgi:succinate dehydrogenase (ubiquinone) cytochrome b560 subunit